MSDLPKAVRILEEGPREGFQIEKGPISTDRKIELINALSETGLEQIQIVSFVNPKAVPGMADADEVAARFERKPGIRYTALWLNERGLQRALASGRLDVVGSFSTSASDQFLKRNQNRTRAEQIAEQHRIAKIYREKDVPIERCVVTAAFGCNFEGVASSPEKIVRLVRELLSVADENGFTVPQVVLADTMAWATPLSVQRLVGAVREQLPSLKLSLHLHDTRGMAIANAYAGLQMGVESFDAAVAGLGGCPFAAHKGAAGNVCTEDLVFMCHEMGIETGVDLERLLETARLAESIVGHPLPGSVKSGGTLRHMHR